VTSYEMVMLRFGEYHVGYAQYHQAKFDRWGNENGFKPQLYDQQQEIEYAREPEAFGSFVRCELRHLGKQSSNLRLAPRFQRR
jgi:hypothetical protein